MRRIRNQLINLRYNDVNHSGLIYNLMQGYKVCIFKKFRKALSQYFLKRNIYVETSNLLSLSTIMWKLLLRFELQQ